MKQQIQLRDYQKKAIEQLKIKYAEGKRRILVWLMTGGGKSVIFKYIVRNMDMKNQRVLFLARRRDLIFQAYENHFKPMGLDCSIIMGSEKGFDPSKNIQICSIDTIGRRLKSKKYDFLKNVENIIVDEAHDCTSDTYKRVLNSIKFNLCISFTATPFQVGNKSHDFWDDYVNPIQAHELRDQGYLCDIDVYAPKEQIDTSGIRRRHGDFSLNEIFHEASQPKIIGDIVENYKKLGKGLPAILFAVNIDHSKMMADAFNERGIPAIHVDQSTKKEDRDKAIIDLQSGAIKVLCNCNLMSVGKDIPEACVCIMARPTESEILYVQQVGRVLRNPPGKPKAILIDHAGNCFRHGMPYDIRNIFIGGDNKKKVEETKTVTAKQCSQCFKILEPKFMACDSCGAELKKPVSDIKHIDGELVKINNTSSHIVSFSKMKQDLKFLDHLGRIKGWKPSAKYFKLHERYRDNIFRYEKELGIPKWLRGTITKNTKTY